MATESPKLSKVEPGISVNGGSPSDEDDDMVICSSRDLQWQQPVVEESEPASSADGTTNLQDEQSNEKLDSTDEDLVKSASDSEVLDYSAKSISPQKSEGISIQKSSSNETQTLSDGEQEPLSFITKTGSVDSEIAEFKTADNILEMDSSKDENANTEFCKDKSVLDSLKTVTEPIPAERVSLSETDAEALCAESNKCSESKDTSSVEIKKHLSEDSNELIKIEKLEGDAEKCTWPEEMDKVHVKSLLDIKKQVCRDSKTPSTDEEDTVVVAASWMEPFIDDLDKIDLEDKDAAIVQLKSQVTRLTSVIRVKDETLKFIEEQTKAEVDKMSAEITMLRAALVDEQKKVMKLEEDIKKKDDVIKKFKGSFERIGKAVALGNVPETNSKSDEEMLQTLTMVKESLPEVSKDVSPTKQSQNTQSQSPPFNPPAAHGKAPSLPPYALGVPASPSQGSTAPIRPQVIHPSSHLTSPRMGTLGNVPMSMTPLQNQHYRAPFVGHGLPNGLRPMAPLNLNPRPAHLKEKSSLPGRITSFGDALSLCVQKHMSNSPGPNIAPTLPQGIPLPPTTQVSLTGLPHGNQPSLPRPAGPDSQDNNQPLDQGQPAQSPVPAAPSTVPLAKQTKKRSRKNPNPMSIKRAKVECYQMFYTPTTPPSDVTEPSVEFMGSEQEEDVDDEPYEIPEELRPLTPVNIKEEPLDIDEDIGVNAQLISDAVPTPSVFPGLQMNDDPAPTPMTHGIPSPPDENSNDSPMTSNVQSLAQKASEFKKRRESLESSSDVNSPVGGQSMHSEDSEYETYAHKPRHKCTFCKPSTSFSYCNDLLMHLYNQHKQVDCEAIQAYLIQTVDVFSEQVLSKDESFYSIVADNPVDGHKKGNICRLCLRKLPSRYMFILHMCTHTGERPYKCEFCSKRFVDGVTLWKHKKIHAEENPELTSPKTEPHASGKPYHCDECGKGFLHQGSLSNHRKLHIGWKPYRCEGCGKEFTRNASLMIHMRSHTKETPFKCQLCGKGFTQSCNLNTHLRIHRGEKPFHCNICNKNFSRKFVLQKHRCIVSPDSPGVKPETNSSPVSFVSA